MRFSISLAPFEAWEFSIANQKERVQNDLSVGSLPLFSNRTPNDYAFSPLPEAADSIRPTSFKMGNGLKR